MQSSAHGGEAQLVDGGDLRGAVFRRSDLSRARFDQVNLTGAVFRGVELVDVHIDGLVQRVEINGVDVGPLVAAELDRRDPERILMRPSDPDGCRAAWALVERRWAETVERARTLPPEQLHVGVAGEWSFIETLRHLLFVTDAWVRRVLQGEPAPWHPLDLPPDEFPDRPGVPRDRTVRPSLDEMVALRRERMAGVRDYLAGLASVDLETHTEPVTEPAGAGGWPAPERYRVADVLRLLLNEEWEHRGFAERDLARLRAGTSSGADV